VQRVGIVHGQVGHADGLGQGRRQPWVDLDRVHLPHRAGQAEGE